MYQNLKPIIDIKWKGAPRAKGYLLHVQSKRRSKKTISTRKARYQFASGSLPDGRNKVFFEALNKAKTRSPVTTIDVIFDNAAPAASISVPPPGGFAPAASVAVKGVATEGSRIRIGTKSVRMGDLGRFSATVPLEPGQRAIAIRIQNKRQGTRYYIRRSTGASRE